MFRGLLPTSRRCETRYFSWLCARPNQATWRRFPWIRLVVLVYCGSTELEQHLSDLLHTNTSTHTIGQTLLVKQAACELHQDVKWVQNAAWGRSGGDFSPIQLISSAARRYSNKQSPTPVRWIAALPAFPTCSWLKSASAKGVQLSSGQSTKTGLFLSVYFKSVLKVPADLCAVVAVVTMNWTHSTEDGGRDGGRLCGCGSYSVCKTRRMKLMMAPERSFCSTAAVGTLKIWIATLHHSVTSIRLHASLKTNVKHTML